MKEISYEYYLTKEEIMDESKFRKIGDKLLPLTSTRYDYTGAEWVDCISLKCRNCILLENSKKYKSDNKSNACRKAQIEYLKGGKK